MIHFGLVKPGSTLRIPFDTFAAATGAPTAVSSFAAADILIYKDGSTTERASTSGYTATTTFDTITGINEAVIDLADDTTADFFKSGSNYVVVISPVTADGQTLSFVAATFTIGYPGAVLNTTIATLASQTSFTLTSGPAEDDALNGMWAMVHDKASAVQATWVQILDYAGSTKTVTLAAIPAATFTIAAIDNFSVIGVMPLQPTVIGRFLDVSTGGEAGVDWANVGSPATTLDLSGTTIKTTQKVDVETIKTNPVVNGGTITFPTAATLASTINITEGTITNLINAPMSGDLTATMKTSVQTAADSAITANSLINAIAGYIDTEITTIVNRIGAFTGSGVNTILGFFQALMRKDSTTPSDLGGTYDDATDSLEAIRDTEPLGTAMRGTDSAALATTALSTTQWTNARAGYLDSLNTGVTIAASQLFVKKNTSLSNFMFKMVLTSDHVTSATGITVTATRAIDGGSFASCANSATEIASGWYKITLAAADLNGTTIALKFTGTACDQRDILIVTQT